MLLESDGARSEIAHSDLQRIDVLVGKERQFVRRMALTMGALAVGIGVINAAKWSASTDPSGTRGGVGKSKGSVFQFRPFGADSRMEAFRVGAKFGGLMIGIPVGIVVGSIKREFWQEGSLSAETARGASIKLAPAAGGGIGLSASVPLGGAVRIR